MGSAMLSPLVVLKVGMKVVMKQIFHIKNSGFTIIEILMVIALVGIVSAVALPQFLDFRKEANTAVTKQKLNELKVAIVGDPRIASNGRYEQPGYLNHMGAAPAALNDLRVRGAQAIYDPFSKRGWRGPYITISDSSWNIDSWGSTLQYSSATRTIRSCGSDKVCNNADDLTVTF